MDKWDEGFYNQNYKIIPSIHDGFSPDIQFNRGDGLAYIKYIILSAILIVAVVMDLNRARISNGLILFGLCAGLVWNGCVERSAGWFFALGGLLLPVASLMLLYIFFALGAGDIKLLAVAGSFLGPITCMKIIILSFFIGAVFTVPVFLKKRHFAYRMHYLANYIHSCFTTGKIRPYYHREAPEGAVIHFSIPIGLAVFFVLFFQKKVSL